MISYLINTTGVWVDFEKKIKCPCCGELTLDEVYLTELWQTQRTPTSVERWKEKKENALVFKQRGYQGAKFLDYLLSTIHQAKGLEWKFVFIIGVCDNHFPSIYSKNDISALEEERRIFYVGVTRAKEDLYITYYVKDFYRNYYYNKSNFIEEIPPSFYENWDFQ